MALSFFIHASDNPTQPKMESAGCKEGSAMQTGKRRRRGAASRAAGRACRRLARVAAAGALLVSLAVVPDAAAEQPTRERDPGAPLLTPLVTFDGALLTEPRARRIARAAGHDLVGVSPCETGDGPPIANCADFDVVLRNGRARIFRVLGIACDTLAFRLPAGARVRRSGLGPLLSEERPVIFGPRCYGAYTAVARIAHDVTADLRARRHVTEGLLKIQRPIAMGHRRWASVSEIAYTTVVPLRDRLTARTRWSVEARGGDGAVTYSESAPEPGIDGARRTGGQAAAPRPALPGVKDICEARRDTMLAASEAVTEQIGFACASAGGFTDRIELTVGTGEVLPGGELTITGDGLCEQSEQAVMAHGRLAAQVVYQGCLEEAVTPPDPPPDGDAPGAPPATPDDPAAPEPACPEVSDLPYTSSSSFEGFDDEGEPMSFYCEQTVQMSCTPDPEMNTCPCAEVPLGAPTCVGVGGGDMMIEQLPPG
jgi:hypothetical protein